MTVYINARFLTQRTTGVQRFATEICKQLRKSPVSMRFVSPKNVLHKSLSEELNVIEFGKYTGHVWEQIELPLWLKRHKSPLLINFANSGPLCYKNQIVTIHDLAFHHHPEWFSKKFAYYYKLLIPLLAKRAIKIFTVSNFVKEDIIKTYNLKGNKIHVIYNAPSDVFTPLSLKRNIILSVGSIEPRKNLTNLIKAFGLINSNELELVLIGEKNKIFNSKSGIPSLLSDKIKFTGYISDHELNRYYNTAVLFVYPSFFEGFGLPPIEAQACKTPVLVSNTSSLPEVCDESVLYFNPFEPIDIANKINKLLIDVALRNKYVEQGWKNKNRFDWRDSGKEVIAVINSLNIA